MSQPREHPSPSKAPSSISRALSTLILRLPGSDERVTADPKSRARALATAAARKAGAISTGLSLPPGPVGMLTILPDLLAIWNLQSKLVADIASAYGKTAFLTRESMVYCLFKHGGAALLRDVVVRTGERFVVRPTTLRVMQNLLSKVGVRTTQRALGQTLARYVPLLGAAAIGAYAYYDTSKVAANAIELFSSEIVIDRGAGSPRPDGA